MNNASQNQLYEEASRLRDRIKSIKHVQKYQSAYIKDLRNIDIFGIYILNGRSCIFGMFYRNGTNYGNKAFFPSHDENANSFEILESFLFQFYSNKEPPLKVIINFNSKDFKDVQTILRDKYKNKIKIINPVKGEKFKHMKLAEKNAMENIKLKSSNIKIHHKLLLEIKKLLKLNQLPQRIEAYDNSHIFGKQSVGVMIVINQEGFETRGYRKFNIRYDKLDEKKSKSNDYYMLEEVLERRLVKLDNENEWINPDIIIIDGGKGHLNIAKKIINKNRKSKIELIAIAKGKDRNSGREIIYYNNEYKILDKKDEFSHFIQKIRDEAHRFAINSHRKRRSKDTIKSVFDEINGIGTIRKKILLEHFGSIKNIRCAKVNELYKVSGISKNLAELIYDFYHSQ